MNSEGLPSTKPQTFECVYEERGGILLLRAGMAPPPRLRSEFVTSWNKISHFYYAKSTAAITVSSMKHRKFNSALYNREISC